mmetsp:Transcript_28637/g.85881  ORF Transcript_28637/g.85881 Transcript_28637/m.85881 type:complete len:287 (+) Transcript_28637:2186-3046(+)
MQARCRQYRSRCRPPRYRRRHCLSQVAVSRIAAKLTVSASPLQQSTLRGMAFGVYVPAWCRHQQLQRPRPSSKASAPTIHQTGATPLELAAYSTWDRCGAPPMVEMGSVGQTGGVRFQTLASPTSVRWTRAAIVEAVCLHRLHPLLRFRQTCRQRCPHGVQIRHWDGKTRLGRPVCSTVGRAGVPQTGKQGHAGLSGGVPLKTTKLTESLPLMHVASAVVGLPTHKLAQQLQARHQRSHCQRPSSLQRKAQSGQGSATIGLLIGPTRMVPIASGTKHRRGAPPVVL